MTYPDPDPRVAHPIEVEVKNWPNNEVVKPPFVKRSTIKTYILDPANVNARNYQITDFEPNRIRMALWVVDFGISVSTSVPTVSPDASTSSAAPQSGGGYLPPNANGVPYEFFGPDAWWLNALGTVTRVTVLKEYTN